VSLTGFNTIQCLLVMALFLGHSVNITYMYEKHTEIGSVTTVS